MADMLARARRDWQRFSTQDFAVDVVLEAPTYETASFKLLHGKHHLAVDTDGRPVNSKQAHITLSEAELTAQNYPLRNDKGEVHLKDHLVKVKDSTGVEKQYKITEWFPDETVGVITCMLGFYDPCDV